MIVLVAKYQVQPGKVDQVLATLEAMAPKVRDLEPGCKVYQVSRSRENENLLLLYEVYEDDAALQAHRETPHFHDLILGRAVPLLERRDLEYFDLKIA